MLLYVFLGLLILVIAYSLYRTLGGRPLRQAIRYWRKTGRFP